MFFDFNVVQAISNWDKKGADNSFLKLHLFSS